MNEPQWPPSDGVVAQLVSDSKVCWTAPIRHTVNGPHARSSPSLDLPPLIRQAYRQARVYFRTDTLDVRWAIVAVVANLVVLDQPAPLPPWLQERD